MDNIIYQLIYDTERLQAIVNLMEDESFSRYGILLEPIIEKMKSDLTKVEENLPE